MVALVVTQGSESVAAGAVTVGGDLGIARVASGVARGLHAVSDIGGAVPPLGEPAHPARAARAANESGPEGRGTREGTP